MNINWGDLEDFLRYVKNPPLSESTIAKHRRTFNRVYPYIKENGWSKDTVLSYVKLKKSEGLLNKSLNDYRKFFRIIDLYLDTDYSSFLRRLPEEATDFDVINAEEKVKIITCDSYGHEDQKQVDTVEYSVIYYLLSELALRIEEALSLTWDNFKGDYMTIRSTKTNRVDDLPISKKLQSALRSLPHKGNRMFNLTSQAVNQDIKARCVALGINKRVTTHTFRRSYVTQALDNGIPEQWLIQITRHSTTASLKPYQQKAMKYKRKVMNMHSFVIESMSVSDKVAYAVERKRQYEDELRALNLPKEELEKILLIKSI